MQGSPEFDGLLPDLEGLDEQNLRDLIERSHQIHLLTQHPGWVYFRDYLVALTGSAQNMILSGSCKTYEDYRAKTGYVSGVRAALEAPDRLIERVRRLQEELNSTSQPE